MKKEYFGSCHCEDGFRFRIEANIEEGRNGICNCSRCEKIGFLHHHVPGTAFKVVRGREEDLTLYTFNTKKAKHLFCPKCGVQSFYRSRSDNEMYDVNLRCIEGLDIYALKYWLIDGQNWEDSQKVRRAYEGAGRRPQLFTILGVHPDARAFFESSHPIPLPPDTASDPTPVPRQAGKRGAKVTKPLRTAKPAGKSSEVTKKARKPTKK